MKSNNIMIDKNTKLVPSSTHDDIIKLVAIKYEIGIDWTP